MLDRIPGAPFAPGVEERGVLVPLELVIAPLVGVARVAGVVQQHVGVEVAPGELADPRLCTGAARPDSDRNRGRQLRGQHPGLEHQTRCVRGGSTRERERPLIQHGDAIPTACGELVGHVGTDYAGADDDNSR